MQGGLKLFDSNRHESFPLFSIRHAGSRFARDATPCESSRIVKCLRPGLNVAFYMRRIELPNLVHVKCDVEHATQLRQLI